MDLFDIVVAKKLAEGGGGGGGSSDFSTAQVTVNHGGLNNYQMPCIQEHMDIEYMSPFFTPINPNTDIATVCLYKGTALFELESAIPMTTSGNIEDVSGDGTIYLITGDCTITFA